jgi:hypothetical protein
MIELKSLAQRFHDPLRTWDGVMLPFAMRALLYTATMITERAHLSG